MSYTDKEVANAIRKGYTTTQAITCCLMGIRTPKGLPYSVSKEYRVKKQNVDRVLRSMESHGLVRRIQEHKHGYVEWELV